MKLFSLLEARRRCTRTGAVAVLTVGAAMMPGASAHAQNDLSPTATRVELEARAVRLDEAIARTGDRDDRRRLEAERTLVRERLSEGDFRAGDRIVLEVRGDTVLPDTVVVREGQRVRLPGMDDIGLHGVLRSELQKHLASELRRYIRDPVITATPLIRIGVLGQVGAPGYYSFRADEPMSDVLMTAGGPTQTADVTQMKIVRGERTLLENEAAREVIAQGRTLDQLNLRAGDQIVVAERQNRNWLEVARNTLWITGAVLGIYGGTRIF